MTACRTGILVKSQRFVECTRSAPIALLRVNMKRWFLILLTVATLAVAKTAEAQDAPDPYLTRISARHVAGAGVGHTSGYSSLDWFLPLSAESDSTMWFGDFRGLIFNDAEFGSNVGTGYRSFNRQRDRSTQQSDCGIDCRSWNRG